MRALRCLDGLWLPNHKRSRSLCCTVGAFSRLCMCMCVARVTVHVVLSPMRRARARKNLNRSRTGTNDAARLGAAAAVDAARLASFVRAQTYRAARRTDASARAREG